MTFSILSQLVWYRTYRRFIKELIDADDFAGARTMLENLIAEHQANMPNDGSIGHSELQHMQHALRHIVRGGVNASSDAPTKSRLTRIFLFEPEQNSE